MHGETPKLEAFRIVMRYVDWLLAARLLETCRGLLLN